MSPLAVLTKLAAMLRIVPAAQFVFDKFAARLGSKESDEPLVSEFLGEASGVTRSPVDQPLFCSRPAITRLQYRKRTTNPREKS